MAALGMRISIASDKPRPLMRGSSDWHMMPSSTNESCTRICPCWCGGKMSMMRLMVWVAELVCSVASVRWPVSAMRSADSTVS